jgi:hypothetical protein
MDAGFYVYRGPRDTFALPGSNPKKLSRDGEPVELDRREASICGRYANRGHRFEFLGTALPEPEGDEPEGDEQEAEATAGSEPVEPGAEPEPEASSRDALTVPELLQIAAELEIAGRSDMNKAALIAAIEAAQTA